MMIDYVLAVVFFFNGQYITYHVDSIEDCLDLARELEGSASVYCRPHISKELSIKELLEVQNSTTRRF